MLLPDILHMYFAITQDCASTFPSGVTINGISSKGGLPAETTKQDFDLLHFAMSAVNLNYRKPLLYVYAQDNQRCHETYSKANTAKLVSDLTNNLYFVRKA